MAVSCLQLLFSFALCLSFYEVHVDCKVERYGFHIPEKGTMVDEEVDVDVEDQTEVIRVPQHNDVDASQVMHDFASGISALRVPSTQDCYVSKLDPSIPSPEKMKLAMEQASKQPLPDKVKIRRSVIRELGFANRLALPQKIRDFCGIFPIYNVEKIPFNSTIASLTDKDYGQGRKKRSHIINNNFHMCSDQDGKRLEYCQNTYGFNFRLKCYYKVAYCYYIVDCSHIGPHPLSATFQCNEVVHMYNHKGLCCKAIC